MHKEILVPSVQQDAWVLWVLEVPMATKVILVPPARRDLRATEGPRGHQVTRATRALLALLESAVRLVTRECEVPLASWVQEDQQA